MSAPSISQAEEQARNVLEFMVKNVQDRPMIHGLLLADLYRWEEIPSESKKRIFERDVRRFAVACPHLAKKDRIKHALEALDGIESDLDSNLFAIA